MSVSQQTYYVVMTPQPGAADLPLRPLSRLLQEDEPAVQQRLSTPAYQILRRYAQKGNAESFQSQLHALGLETLVISDTQISGHLFLWAASANQGQGGMAINDFDGKPLYCPFDDLITVCIGTVQKKDGGSVMMIDLHRRSTSITPRLDTSLFDFEQVTTRSGANANVFLDDLSERLPLIDFDRQFDSIAHEIEPAVRRGLARFPGQFPPPNHDYDSLSLKLFDVYSFLERERRIITPH